MSSRTWTTEQEILLFSLVVDLKPSGKDKESNVAELLREINKNNTSPFTETQLWEKLAHHFDLAKVDEIELQTDASDSDKAKLEKGVRKLRDAKDSEEAEDEDMEPDATDMYSSELSDIEGEVPDMSKIHSEEAPAAKRGRPKGRGRKPGSTKRETKSETPKTETPKAENTKPEPSTGRKRTRLVAKLTDTPRKGKALRASPSARKKMKTRSTPEPPELNETDATAEPATAEPAETPGPEPTKSKATDEETKAETPDEEPKTRRSRRQAVRRSSRIK